MMQEQILLQKKLDLFRERNKEIKINFFTNLETEDYLKLIRKSECLVGNSSSGIRESSFLGIPTVNIGDRQHLRERGNNVIDVQEKSEKIFDAIKKISKKKIKKSNLYGTGNSSKKIVRILSSIKLINKKNFYIK